VTPAEIVAFRKRLGLTQARLAALLPAPKRTIENWEGGRRNPPAYLQRALRDLEHELTAIVRDLATGGPYVGPMSYCAFCTISEGGRLEDPSSHEQDCLWRRAQAACGD
jgi:DNA-binding XRE family transcriptional regulator